MSRQSLESITDETYDRFNDSLWQCLVLLDSVSRHGSTYECIIVWHFQGSIPEFQYRNTIEQVTVGDKEVTIRFESISDDEMMPDEWMIREIPILRLVESDSEISTDTLERVLGEVYLDAEYLHEFAVESDGRTERHQVDAVSLKSATTQENAVVEELTSSPP